MARRLWLVLAILVAAAPLSGCGLLASGGDSRTVVADVDRDQDPDAIPTPARPPIAVDTDIPGLALPGDAGQETPTADDPASARDGIDPADDTIVDVTLPPVTAPPETAPPETFPPVTFPPVTTTTIDVQTLPDVCVATLRFFQEGMRLYEEVPTASGERIASLVAAVLGAMERLDTSAPGFIKPVIVDLLNGRELLPEFAKADSTTARILFRDFIEVKRPASNALLAYFFGVCPGVGTGEALPAGRDGWTPTTEELARHLGLG